MISWHREIISFILFIIYQMEEEKKIELDTELINKAIEIIKDNNTASVTILCRKLWISYVLASKIIDSLESAWFIWPAIWAKKREIYIH